MKLNCMCKLHNSNIQFISLHPEDKIENRLLCKDCHIDQPQIFDVDSIIEYLECCQSSENNINENILKLEEQYNNFRVKVLALLEFQENMIKNLKEQFNMKSRIIEQNCISTFLEKQNDSSEEELINMANQLAKILAGESELTNIRYNEIEFYSNYVQEKFEELLNHIDIKRISQIVESSQQHQDDFIEIAQIKLEPQNKINDIQFNRTNFFLAIGGSLNQETQTYLQIYQCENNQMKFLCSVNGPKSEVRAICFSHNDDSFFSGEENQQVLYFRQSKQNEWGIEQVITGFQFRIHCLQLQYKNNMLAVGSSFTNIYQQNLNQKQEWQLFQKLEKRQSKILLINFSKSSQRQLLVTATIDPLINLYEFSKKKQFSLLMTFDDFEQNIRCLKFYKDEDIYVLLNDSQSIYFAYSQESLDYDRIITQLNQLGNVICSDFNAKTSNLILQAKFSNEVKIFNVNDSNTFTQHPQGIQFKAEYVHTSNDGQRLVLIGQQILKIYSYEQNND